MNPDHTEPGPSVSDRIAACRDHELVLRAYQALDSAPHTWEPALASLRRRIAELEAEADAERKALRTRQRRDAWGC